MRVRLKTYSDPHRYEKDHPDNEETVESTTEALKVAKEGVANVRGTNHFIGYKIYEVLKSGKLGRCLHRLPGY